MESKDRFQRIIWSCIYISLISGATYFVGTLWNIFLTNPTVTTLVSSTYPVNIIPFPAVSVCSINKISKKRAASYAIQIAKLAKRDPQEIMEFISFIGKLYDFNLGKSATSKLLEFQNILDMLKINLKELIKNISTPCEELLRSCYWRNIQVKCSSVFTTRLTYEGYCCVFNYIKITNEMIETQMPDWPVTTDAGVENGLYVSVHNYLYDYYYTTLSSAGVMVHVFSPNEYPDKTSGSLIEIFTEPNSENFIEIIPTTLISAPEVASYPTEKRDCLFDQERTTDIDKIYSPSDCNVDCRLKSIKAVCHCIPFFIPFNSTEDICTLVDIPCLSKFRDKWNSFYPEDDVEIYLKKEKQDSLRCEDPCYPSCTKTIYEAFTNSFPIFNKTENRLNITHIYFYYLNRFSNMYLQDIVYYWFEALSNFGGIFGIFVGWSLITLLQLICYYLKKIIGKLLAYM